LIAECPEEWGEFCTGDEKKRGKLQGFFTGKIMKATKGQADGKAVAALLEARRSQQP
jgi:aspartyl-tRNA(Asn)/glutamyl-tRNA(Gln) amidotransferase subunit B